MFKRIGTAFISVVLFVSFFYTSLPTKAFTEEDAYAYSAHALNVGMKNKQEVIDLSAYMLSAEFAEQLYYDVLLSDPYLYFVKTDYKETTCVLSEDGNYIDSYKIEYYFTETSVTDVIFAEHIEKAVSEIPVEGMHTVDLMLAIHEYIASNVDKETSLGEVTDNHLCSTAYGALVYGCADSLGFALMNMVLAEAITENECIVVSDEDKTSFWNMYLLNGNWYNIDVYADDTEVFYVDGEQNVTDTYVIGSMRNHIYFLETTNIMSMYGHYTPVAYIYGGTPASNTDTIRIRIWNNITSPMFYYEGYWHYVSPTSPDVIVRRLTNIVAVASAEETVFMADGNIISFTKTSDSIYYAIDTGYVKEFPISLIDRSDDFETDVETDAEAGTDENPEQSESQEQTSVEKDIYVADSGSEIVLGLGTRDDHVYYELYNTAESLYSYNVVCELDKDVKLNFDEEKMIVSGLNGNSRVMDLFDIISKDGRVSRYEAYNSLKVLSDEQELNLSQFIPTGTKLVLNDNTEYLIAVRGDVISGSNINIIDLMTALNYISGSVSGLSALQLVAMDYDGADGVNVADVALMYNAMTDIKSVIDSDAKFDVLVNGGTANIEGESVTESSHGYQVNIVADIPEGMVFDKWIVVSGNVTFANEKSSSTCFIMPYHNVEVTATFKDVSVTVGDITFDNVSERYTETVSEPISITNNGDVILTNPFVSLRSGSEYFDLITYSLPYYIGVGDTNNTSYAIQPKVFLPYGTYTAEIVLTANELDTDVCMYVTFTVEHRCYGVIVEGQAPDCTTDGWKDYCVCTCGKYSVDKFGLIEIADIDEWKAGEGRIPAHGHAYKSLVQKVDPVHTESELTAGREAHYFCELCDTYFTADKNATTFEALEIPVPDHTHCTYEWDDDSHWSVCECGAVVDDSDASHDFGEGDALPDCKHCGYVKDDSGEVTEPVV